MRGRFLSGVVVVLILVVCAVAPAGAFTEQWAHMLGSAGDEGVVASTTDAAGDLLVVGTTTGQLPGSPTGNPGMSAAFVARYSSAGALMWVREIGAPGATTTGSGIAVNAAGDVFVVGTTDGTIENAAPPNAGGLDVFAVRYTLSGTERWAHMFGGTADDSAAAAGVDGDGNVLIAGTTGGMLGAKSLNGQAAAFVVSLTPAHKKRWISLYGGTQRNQRTYALGFTADCLGNLYISGSLAGTVLGSYVASFDTTGALRWATRTGTYTGDAVSHLSAGCDGAVYGGGASRDYPTTKRRPPVEPYIFRMSANGLVGWQDFNAGATYSPTPVVDTANGVLYDVTGPGVAMFTTSDGAFHFSSSVGNMNVDLQTGVLDPSGQLDVSGLTHARQLNTPETYAGGFSDAYVTGISDPINCC